jgi:hypothetical protein
MQETIGAVLRLVQVRTLDARVAARDWVVAVAAGGDDASEVVQRQAQRTIARANAAGGNRFPRHAILLFVRLLPFVFYFGGR